MNAVDFRLNGATGVSDMAGAAAKVAVERCGKQPRYNEMIGERTRLACYVRRLAELFSLHPLRVLTNPAALRQPTSRASLWMH